MRWIIQSFGSAAGLEQRVAPAAARSPWKYEHHLASAATSRPRRCRDPRSSSCRRRSCRPGSRPRTPGTRADGPRCAPPCGCCLGSSGIPLGTAHEASTPSCSRRRSQCRRVAECSWTTKRGCAGALPFAARARAARAWPRSRACAVALQRAAGGWRGGSGGRRPRGVASRPLDDRLRAVDRRAVVELEHRHRVLARQLLDRACARAVRLKTSGRTFHPRALITSGSWPASRRAW